MTRMFVVALICGATALVAQSQTTYPTKFSEALASRPEVQQALEALLVDKEREGKVIELSAHLARIYEFDESQAAGIFAWIIRTTVRVEVRYLQTRIGEELGDILSPGRAPLAT